MSLLGAARAVDKKPKLSDFRSLLQQELLQRCKANPRYSLRAFAQFLRLESSALSKILAGKRAISPAMFDRLAKRLALDPSEAARLRPARLRRRGLLESAAQREDSVAPDYRELSLDLFQTISEWYHYAILELTRTKGFVSEPRWVARALGLTVSEVNIAVQRLQRLEMLRIDSHGRWIDESGAVTNIQDEFTSIALRKLQRQVLEKAMIALEEVPITQRDQTSMTMAIDSRRLPEAKTRIAKFRRELCAYLKSGSPYDRVYHLSVSLYPVSAAPAAHKKERFDEKL